MPSTGAELGVRDARGRELGDVMRARRTQTTNRALRRPASGVARGTAGVARGRRQRGPLPVARSFSLRFRFDPHRWRILARPPPMRDGRTRSSAFRHAPRDVAPGPRRPADRRARRRCDPVAAGVRVGGSSRASQAARRGDRPRRADHPSSAPATWSTTSRPCSPTSLATRSSSCPPPRCSPTQPRSPAGFRGLLAAVARRESSGCRKSALVVARGSVCRPAPFLLGRTRLRTRRRDEILADAHTPRRRDLALS